MDPSPLRPAATGQPVANLGPRTRAALAVLTTLLALGGCSRPKNDPSPAPSTADRGTVVIAYGIDMLGINELIHRRTAVQSGLLLFTLFSPLLEEQGDHQKGPPTFEPRLAESYEFSADRLTLTFRLRPGLLWSDGAPITAEDVRWTWQAQTAPEVAWDYAQAKEHIKDVEVVDPLTVRYHFDKVYASQLLEANEGVILPRHVWSRLPFSEWRKNASWFDQHAVCSGPFVLESWEPQQRITLRRNPHYFAAGLPRLEKLVLQIIPDPSSQLALLRSGKVQLDEVDPYEAATVKSDPQLELVAYSPRQFVFIGWNVSRPLFADRRVRQALTLGIDRHTIIETIYYGYALLTSSPYAINSWVHNDKLEPWPYDPARARELLREAGWSDGDGDGILDKDGKKFSFELLTNADNRLRTDIQVMVQDQLRQIGIEVRPRAVEFNSLSDRLYSHDFDATVNSVGVDTSHNLYYNFHSKAIGEFNWGLYSNPEVDRLIEQLEGPLDPAAAKPLYDRLQLLLHEDQPLTFLYEPQRLIAIRRELHGVRPSSLSTFANVREWSLGEPNDKRP